MNLCGIVKMPVCLALSLVLAVTAGCRDDVYEKKLNSKYKLMVHTSIGCMIVSDDGIDQNGGSVVAPRGQGWINAIALDDACIAAGYYNRDKPHGNNIHSAINGFLLFHLETGKAEYFGTLRELEARWKEVRGTEMPPLLRPDFD